MRGKKKHFVLTQGKGVGERDGYCKSTNKQLSLSREEEEEETLRLGYFSSDCALDLLK